MKKILLIFASITMIICLCSCSPKEEKIVIPEVDPASLITAEDIAANAGYTPVVEPSQTMREGNTATVLYRSEPIGQNDIVKVTVTQFTDTINYQQIYADFDQAKMSRSSAETITGVGQDAYVAFPSIHVYDRGCVIDITAGSGADDTQKSLLINLALTAAGRLESIIPDQTNGN
ncbi:MAG: hypothetical protein J1F01_01430 [Oscillospiraceae bacterium]|nr:hypothetical protein [Oscillospiraceae bacterium]